MPPTLKWTGRVMGVVHVANHWVRLHWPTARGGDLILFAVVWTVVGLKVLQRDPEPQQKVPIEYLGIEFRAGIWFVAAAIAVLAAFAFDGKGDRWGFTALMIPPALRASSYWIAWASGLVTEKEFGFVGLWPDALAWTAVCILVFRLARRAEIPPAVAAGVRRYNRRSARKRAA